MIDFLLGSAKTVQECADFGVHLNTMNVSFAILITPSELVHVNLEEIGFTQHFRIDSAFLSDVLCGAWGVFIRGPIKLQELRQPSVSGKASCLGEWMTRA